MQVRPVTQEDFRAVCALLGDLGRPRVTDASIDACRTTFFADLGDDRADHLIAVDDQGSAIGFLSLHYRRRLNHASDEAWVPDLIVNERASGRARGRFEVNVHFDPL